ncbi:hypothetical protein [Kribbella sp.]|uniref:hypothetical protein n=1 Tax=Kribbella sp. TaxID=1871183 RepID=UPI002D243E60|nr:hypothetical protein [Kribbella sp.]HZX09193.1 hypothetical protein [Kribbella sp.]
MTAGVEAPGTQINQPSGPVNTGTGDQLNDVKNYFERPRKARTWEVTPGRLHQLWATFVQPAGFHDAAEILAQRDGLVILAGATGSGRHTAGLMLLSADIAPETVVRLVPPDLEPVAVQAERRMFDGSDVRDDDRLLLDLSEADAESFTELQSYLHALQPELDRHRAKLVVVLPQLDGDHLRSEFVPFVIRLERPDKLRVLQRHFAAHGLQIEDIGRFRQAFASVSLSAIVRVVYQVRDASRQHPQADVGGLLADVLGSAERRKQKVAAAVGSAREARLRALLIAAALLHGHSTEVVFLAQQRLHDLLRATDDGAQHPLELPGVSESLDQLELELSVAPGHGQRVRFADQELAASVLRHFWDEMPWLRSRLTDWIGDEVVGRSTGDFDPALIAHRFGTQCRRTRQADLAIRLIVRWSGDRRQPQRSAAYTLLEDLLDDDRTGVAGRQLLYDWARDGHLPRGQAAIAVAACVNILADGYLDRAVVRLAWLARHSDDGVRSAAREGLGRLADDPRNRLKVIDLVLEPWRFRPMTFASTAAPARLLMFLGTAAEERIADGWRRTLTDSDPSRRGELLTSWLATHNGCLSDDRPAEARGVLQFLATICGPHPELLNALFNTTLSWLEAGNADPLRLRTAQAIDELVRRGRRAAATTVLEVGS